MFQIADVQFAARIKSEAFSAIMMVGAVVLPPTRVGGNTNAPTIMIAEKAADMIRTAD